MMLIVFTISDGAELLLDLGISATIVGECNCYLNNKMFV